MALTNHIRNYPNLERSAFRRGEYVGYAQGTVRRVRKVGKLWHATSLEGREIIAATLYLMSEKLAKLG